MNQAGCLLDTGPLVALLSENDQHHPRAKALFASVSTPFRTCEAVVAEACFLLKRFYKNAPAEVLALGEKGFYEISFSLKDHWAPLQTLFKKYQNRPISLADASLIRCAEIHNEPRILTFDSDFEIYRWGRNKKFEIGIF